MVFPELEKKSETKMAEYSVASSSKQDVKKVYITWPVNSVLNLFSDWYIHVALPVDEISNNLKSFLLIG